MKLVKSVDGEINRGHNGVELKITQEGIAVSDEVASELHILFGHRLEISDIKEEEKVVPEEQGVSDSEDETVTEDDSVEASDETQEDGHNI